MKRQAIQIAVDGDGNLYALASDGTIWTQGTRGWDKVAELPEAPDVDPRFNQGPPQEAPLRPQF